MSPDDYNEKRTNFVTSAQAVCDGVTLCHLHSDFRTQNAFTRLGSILVEIADSASCGLIGSPSPTDAAKQQAKDSYKRTDKASLVAKRPSKSTGTEAAPPETRAETAIFE
jgi:hypothetical protein